MTKEELLSILKELQENGDQEIAHAKADDALLEYINDEDVSKAFEEIDKWYA